MSLGTESENVPMDTDQLLDRLPGEVTISEPVPMETDQSTVVSGRISIVSDTTDFDASSEIDGGAAGPIIRAVETESLQPVVGTGTGAIDMLSSAPIGTGNVDCPEPLSQEPRSLSPVLPIQFNIADVPVLRVDRDVLALQSSNKKSRTEHFDLERCDLNSLKHGVLKASFELCAVQNRIRQEEMHALYLNVVSRSRIPNLAELVIDYGAVRAATRDNAPAASSSVNISAPSSPSPAASCSGSESSNDAPSDDEEKN